MRIKTLLITIASSIALTSIGASINKPVHASSVVPKKYQGYWHNGQYSYKIGPKYGHFSDTYGQTSFPFKFKKIKHGWYGGYPIKDSPEPIGFKTSGNHITIFIASTKIKLYK